MVVKTAFCVSVGNLRGGFRFWGNVFFCFGEYRKLFRLFVGNFLTRLSKLLSTCSLEQFGDDLFKKKCSSFHSLPLWPKKLHHYGKFFLAFWLYCIGRIETAFYLPSRPFEWVSFFSERNVKFLTFPDTEWKKFVHLSKIFGPGSPNWFLRKQR